jgi:hypothetical protein
MFAFYEAGPRNLLVLSQPNVADMPLLASAYPFICPHVTNPELLNRFS